MGEYPAPDLLEAFIKSRRPLTQAGAAGQIGIVPAALHGYLRRKQRPRSDIRQRIAKWSGGAVPESAWLTEDERVGLDVVDAAVIPHAPAVQQPHQTNDRKPTGTDS